MNELAQASDIAKLAEGERLTALYARIGNRRERYVEPTGASIDIFEMDDREAITKFVGVWRSSDGGGRALPFFTREGVLEYAARMRWVPA